MLGMRIATLLRTHGWALNLLFILLAAYFVAGAMNSVLARSIRVVPSLDEGRGAVLPQGAAGPSRQGFTMIAERNLMAAKREVMSPLGGAVPVEPTLAMGRNYDPAALKPCTVAANVRATMVAEGAPEWSMAVLFINNETTVFSVNEGRNHIADDAVLVDVLDRAIVVRRRDHFERCAADDASPMAVASVATVVSSPADSAGGPAGPDGGAGVTKISETQYNVERAEVDRALTNLNEVATQARIVPSFKNGKANGFKLFSIKPGSIFAKIGLQNGDVIQRINGYEMNSPDKALEIYGKLKEATSLGIELQRGGRTMTVNYSIGG